MLSAIHGGAKLKKATTVDKSGVPGAVAQPGAPAPAAAPAPAPAAAKGPALGQYGGPVNGKWVNAKPPPMDMFEVRHRLIAPLLCSYPGACVAGNCVEEEAEER